jgi:hypothetical protein
MFTAPRLIWREHRIRCKGVAGPSVTRGTFYNNLAACYHTLSYVMSNATLCLRIYSLNLIIYYFTMLLSPNFDTNYVNRYT